MVRLKDSDSGPTHRRQPKEHGALPGEVFLPEIEAGMKQPNCPICLWVDPGEIGSLMLVAPQAGPSQICQDRGTAVLLGADVIELKAQFAKALRKVAVLATESGASLHFGLKPRLHVRHLGGRFGLAQRATCFGFEKHK